MYRSTFYQMTAIWVASFSVLGCNPSSMPDPSTGTSSVLGQFDGSVIAQWSDNGREMILQQPVSFIDSTSKRWVAPAGAIVDGASIPSVFWSAIGGPFEGKYRNASVVHDVYCNEMTEPWEDVHLMFYEACRSGGVSEAQANMLYYAVYHFGPRWEMVTEAEAPAFDQQPGISVRRDREGHHMACYQPAPPTIEEVEQVAEFVSEEAPTANEVRKMDRDQLHRRPRRSRSSEGRSNVGQASNGASNGYPSNGYTSNSGPSNDWQPSQAPQFDRRASRGVSENPPQR
ncbi:DUF1353 domain-containing protein [Neorhodopirellula lusitana]|uniref:DUF1353 domain-containing protein n=1 Tax=Neorhodopirellula lusitana TaxID=445327 RepID=UPI00384F8140